MANANKEKPPEECRTCKEAVNAINGKYCLKLKRYVEYADTPPCK